LRTERFSKGGPLGRPFFVRQPTVAPRTFYELRQDNIRREHIQPFSLICLSTNETHNHNPDIGGIPFFIFFRKRHGRKAQQIKNGELCLTTRTAKSNNGVPETSNAALFLN